MRLVDTHCHLHFPDFDADREAMIERAREAGVEFFVNVGTDPLTNKRAQELASKYPFMVHSAGLHPHLAHETDEAMFAQLETQVKYGKPSAIGEIGLDYFKSEAPAEMQKMAFLRMLRLAKANDLPVIVHSRNAFDDTYALLKKESEGLRGVMHCYSYDEESMRKLVDIGMYISFACNVTYKNATMLVEAAKKTPSDRILFETDSPYLSPQTKRGKRNEPANLAELAPFLAAARGEDVQTLAAAAADNAKRLFGGKR